MIFLLLVLAAAIIIFITIIAIYFKLYKRNLDRVIAEKDTPHIHMVPPYKIAVFLSVILLFGVVSLFSIGHTSDGIVSGVSLPLDQYLREVNNPGIEQWVSACTSDGDKAYILQYRNSSGSNTIMQYLIYVPCAADDANNMITYSHGLFGVSATLDLEAVDGNRGNMVTLVTYVGDSPFEIKVNYGGQNMDYVISEADVPMELFQ